jgi:hypothetical protein
MAFAANTGIFYDDTNNVITVAASINAVANLAVSNSSFLILSPQNATNAALVNGMIWTSNVYNGFKTYQAGASSILSAVLFVANNFTNCNSTVETSMIPSGIGTTSLPANYFTPGKAIRVRLLCAVSLPGGGAGTILVNSYLGNTNTTAMPPVTLISPQANTNLLMEATYTCIAVGNSTTGNFRTTVFVSGAAVTSLQGSASNTTGVSLDTTVPQTINVTCILSSGGNTRFITCSQGTVEVLG